MLDQFQADDKKRRFYVCENLFSQTYKQEVLSLHLVNNVLIVCLCVCVCFDSSLSQRQCSHWCPMSDCCLAPEAVHVCLMQTPTGAPRGTRTKVVHTCLCVCVTTLLRWKCRPLSVTVSPGHGSVFSCCNPAKLRDRSATFFIIHALGGAILFITDGIIVRLPANTTHNYTWTQVKWEQSKNNLLHTKQDRDMWELQCFWLCCIKTSSNRLRLCLGATQSSTSMCRHR